MKRFAKTPSNKRAFPDKLKFEDAGMRGNSRCLRLTARFRYRSSKGVIEVPEGFITDGASIPQAFWNILSPFGEYFAAAVIHDFLYSLASEYKFTRKEIDLIFKEAMYNDGVDWLTREIVYRAVQLFGGFSFKKPKEDPVMIEPDDTDTNTE
jgi:hypothetical protein